MVTDTEIKDGEAPSEKKTWKARIPDPVDLEYLYSLDFKEKVYYLAVKGWKVEKEIRSGKEYLYAIKYIERKKRRIYLGKTEDHPEF